MSSEEKINEIIIEGLQVDLDRNCVELERYFNKAMRSSIADIVATYSSKIKEQVDKEAKALIEDGTHLRSVVREQLSEKIRKEAALIMERSDYDLQDLLDKMLRLK